jgi:hypothetical protein
MMFVPHRKHAHVLLQGLLYYAFYFTSLLVAALRIVSYTTLQLRRSSVIFIQLGNDKVDQSYYSDDGCYITPDCPRDSR